MKTGTKKITLLNNFHGTSIDLVVEDKLTVQLSVSQSRRVRRELCGVSDCECGAVRGPQGGLEVVKTWVGAAFVYEITDHN